MKLNDLFEDWNTSPDQGMKDVWNVVVTRGREISSLGSKWFKSRENKLKMDNRGKPMHERQRMTRGDVRFREFISRFGKTIEHACRIDLGAGGFGHIGGESDVAQIVQRLNGALKEFDGLDDYFKNDRTKMKIMDAVRKMTTDLIEEINR